MKPRRLLTTSTNAVTTQIVVEDASVRFFLLNLKAFGFLVSFDIIVSIKSFLTEKTMSIGTKTTNGLSLNSQGIRPGNMI